MGYSLGTSLRGAKFRVEAAAKQPAIGIRRRPCALDDRGEDGGVIWRLAVALRLTCMCGYVIQGDDEDEFWRNAQEHMGVLQPARA
jgi:hypothetical protein